MLNFLNNLHLDRLSFWLGFLAASLFWWVISFIRSQMPRLKGSVKVRTEASRKRSTSAIEERLRKLTHFKAQNMHLAYSLFPLDEIIIPPRLLCSALPVEPDGSLPVEDTSQLLVPCMPDWPELTAPFSLPVITLAEALRHGANIAIIGKPGSGKTVCMAHLASQIARRDPLACELVDSLPVILHVSDLAIPEKPPYDPLHAILAAVSHSAPVLVRRQLPRYLRSLFSSGKLILFLDGADELSQADLQKLAFFLGAMIKDFPKVHFAITGSTDFLDGLLALGIVPLTLAGWSALDKKRFVQQWCQKWQDSIEPEIARRKQVASIDYFQVAGWLLEDSNQRSPFELTLQAWSAFAGDARGPRNADAIEAYLRRIITSDTARIAVGKLAMHTILAGQSTFLTGSAGGFFSEIERSIPELTERGLLVNRANANLSFNHPIFSAYLASSEVQQEEQLTQLMAQPTWTSKTLLLKYLAIHLDMSAIVDLLTKMDAIDPLRRNIFWMARWLPDGPPGENWRNVILRGLVDVLRRESYPLGIRARAAAALIASNDPSIPTIFRQLLVASSPVVRQLGCLGCGAILDSKSITDLGGLLSDPSPWVRYAACMALVAIGTNPAIKIATEVLMYGDENMGRVVAEALASQPPYGHDLLRESSASTNLLVRRASVFGLIRVKESWANQILEKMRVEDGQWVVRNAASHAVETMNEANPYLPRPLPPPHETPWLVAFASRQGAGLSPQQPVKEIIFNVLVSGTSEEKQAVFNYIRLVTNPDAGLIGAVYKVIYGEDGPVREAACYALWLLAVSGAELPSPLEFGMG